VLGLLVLGYLVLTLGRDHAHTTGLLFAAAVLLGVLAIMGRTIGQSIIGKMVMVIFGLAMNSAFLPGHAGDPVRVASLGDSYSSGEGTRAAGYGYDGSSVFGGTSPLAGSPDCHRSSAAYPRQLFSHYGLPELLFVACTGATTEDILNRNHNGELPQLFVLENFVRSGRRLDAVTVGVGGNDLDFRGILEHCITGNCSAVDPFTFKPGMSRARFVAMLQSVYRRIRGTVGEQVPLFVIGYPSVFPVAPACRIPAATTGDLGMPGFDVSELRHLHDVAAHLNEAIREATTAEGAIFVDVTWAFDGHEICSSLPFVNGVIAPGLDAWLGDLSVVDVGSFHPNDKGHACLTSTIRKQVPDFKAVTMGPIGRPRPSQVAVGSAKPCG